MTLNPNWIVDGYAEYLAEMVAKRDALGPRPRWWRPGARRDWDLRHYQANLFVHDAINDLARARMLNLRQAAKPLVFHKANCPHGRTATCLCGKEPNQSPAARRARGETP